MKKLRYVLILMLCVLGSSQVEAQMALEDGDAFYVYRNDGDFNGFFYDDVLEMRYSKFDLDSLEYDEYVIQDIVTVDSVYRIPISVIDSISFVQPEIILNDGLFNMDAVGTTAYVISAQGRSVLLNSKTPADLMPKVGNVVIGVDESVYGEDFRAFKVKKIETTADGILVTGDKITSLSDVFVQFVSVESVGLNDEAKARRRIAGLNTLTKASGQFNANLINFSGTLQREFELGANSSVTLMLNLGLGFGLDVAYRITTSELFVKVNMKESVSAQVGAKLAVTGSGNRPVKLIGDIGSIKFPGFLPVFQVDPIPTGVFRYGGELSASVTMPGFSYESSQTIIFNSNARPMLSGTWYSNEGKPEEKSMKDMLTSPDFGISLNGFMQLGIQLDGKLKTNSWISDIFSSGIGVEVNVGPKLSGNFSFSYGQYRQDALYGALKDSKITFTPCSIDTEAKAELSFLGDDPEAKTFYSTSTSFGDFDLYLLPEVSHDVVIDEYEGTLDITASLKRLIALPVEMIYEIYRKDMFDPKDPSSKQLAYIGQWKESYAGILGDTLTWSFEKVSPGKYVIVPKLHTMITGDVYLISLAKEFTIKNPKPRFTAARVYATIKAEGTLTTDAGSEAIEIFCSSGKEGDSPELSLTYDDYIVTGNNGYNNPLDGSRRNISGRDTTIHTVKGREFLDVNIAMDFSDPDTIRIDRVYVNYELKSNYTTEEKSGWYFGTTKDYNVERSYVNGEEERKWNFTMSDVTIKKTEGTWINSNIFKISIPVPKEHISLSGFTNASTDMVRKYKYDELTYSLDNFSKYTLGNITEGYITLELEYPIPE